MNVMEDLDKTIRDCGGADYKTYVIFDSPRQYEYFSKLTGGLDFQNKNNPIFFYFKSRNQRIGFIDLIDQER